MSIVPLSFELAEQIYNSPETFPVHFDDAWQWMEYSRKDSAKRILEKNFVEGEDYQLHKVVEPTPAGGSSNREEIYLTANCFKEMGMMAGTEKGKEIRRHFIRCEEKLKELLKAKQQSKPEPEPDRPQFKELPVIMPTPEEIEFMRSPSARSHANWMQLSGYDRALDAVRKHRSNIVPQ